MGNCQAGETMGAVTVEQGGVAGTRVEQILLAKDQSILAKQLMAANPGHFVALLLPTPLLPANHGLSRIVTTTNEKHIPSPSFMHSFCDSSATNMGTQLIPRASESNFHRPVPAEASGKPVFKLLPAEAPLCVGNRYRLFSFEEVFIHFSKCDNIGGGRTRDSKERTIIHGLRSQYQSSESQLQHRLCQRPTEYAHRFANHIDQSFIRYRR